MPPSPALGPPHRRPVNTVFQSYALFGHLSVADNVAFGLRVKRHDKSRIAERVGAGSVVLFHHGPHRTDDALDEIRESFTASMPIVVAAEGLALDLP